VWTGDSGLAACKTSIVTICSLVMLGQGGGLRAEPWMSKAAWRRLARLSMEVAVRRSTEPLVRLVTIRFAKLQFYGFGDKMGGLSKHQEKV